MLKFLCADTANSTTSIIIYVVLIVALLFILVAPFFTQKKKNREYQDMLSSLKAGDIVRTAGGVIGRIVRIVDKGEIKTVILETGSKTEKSYMELDLNMIYCILKSSKAEAEEPKTEEIKEDVKSEEPKIEEVKLEEPETETKVDEVNAEEKPKKKRTSVSSSKKKTK